MGIANPKRGNTKPKHRVSTSLYSRVNNESGILIKGVRAKKKIVWAIRQRISL